MFSVLFPVLHRYVLPRTANPYCEMKWGYVWFGFHVSSWGKMATNGWLFHYFCLAQNSHYDISMRKVGSNENQRNILYYSVIHHTLISWLPSDTIRDADKPEGYAPRAVLSRSPSYSWLMPIHRLYYRSVNKSVRGALYYGIHVRSLYMGQLCWDCW